MGKKALLSHAKGTKHPVKEKLFLHIKQEPISAWAKSVPASDHPSTVAVASTSKPEADVDMEDLVVPSPPPMQNPKPVQKDTSRQTSMDTYAAKDDTLRAEILWAMKCLHSHYSCNSSSSVHKLFQTMFPDSAIAKQFSCGKTKCLYLIKYGLAPYFHQKVVDTIQKPGCLFTVCFDESFNRVIQEEQMDLVLHFWDNERKQVISRYFGSKFLGHRTASDLLDNFLKSLESFNQANLLQISMDGPRTNWKFFDNLKTQLAKQDPDLPQLLNVGSCGLHVVHGAFQSGERSTEWHLDSLLQAMNYCLHDSPATREDCKEVTGSSTMPLRFCATRWIEDVQWLKEPYKSGQIL